MTESIKTGGQGSSRYWVDGLYPVNVVEIKGQVFSYRKGGLPRNQKPVMVLLHGIGSGSGSWAHTLAHFEDEYYVIAWDAPGYNLSTNLSPRNPGALGYARALDKFLNALGISPSIVVGHSLGALVAGAYVANVNPALPILVLADPANGYGNMSPEVQSEKLAARLRMVRELGSDGMAEKRSAHLLSSSPGQEAMELVKWNMKKVTPRGYEQASRTLVGGHLMQNASQFHGAVLVLCGSEDQVTPVEACQDVSEAFTGARFEVLPGLGHASYVEGPVLFNEAIESFLGV